MAISFPDPVLGDIKRPKGQGCLTCVHNLYCQSFYWYQRFTENVPDGYVGVQCASYSNNEEDRILEPNADDLALNARLNNDGILTEPKSDGQPEGNYEAYQ